MRTKTWITGMTAVLAVTVLLVTAGCGGGGSSCPTCTDDRPPIEPPPSYDNHDEYFLVNDYVDATTCTQSGCHPNADNQLMSTVHWNWESSPNAIAGSQGSEDHGKNDLINNFCIAIPGNEGRCTQCHAGYGYADDTFDFSDVSKMDCLVCHDQTGTYAKAPKTAGNPDPVVDLQFVAQSCDKGEPTRNNCGACHFYAGGGDNVKHGDLAAALNEATFEMDVHMNATGMNFSCQRCHDTMGHEIAGQGLHFPTEGETDCTDCHSISNHAVIGGSAKHLESVACQTCHIPTFSRAKSTKVEWYWATAGQDIPVEDIPIDEFGNPTYNKLKGDFVFDMFVEPEILWYNHEWDRMVVGQNDTWTQVPVVIAAPTATIDTTGAKLYPFKKMIGNQPADMGNQRILSPHLFGVSETYPSPYWGVWDWNLALQEGAAYTGLPYSGEWGFVDTVMYLSINHEVAPATEARQCIDCHGPEGLDWEELGFSSNPFPMGV